MIHASMKKILTCLPLYISLLLFSCSDTATEIFLHHLDLIKEKGNENPMEALTELLNIASDAEATGSEYAMNKYRLLKIRLSDKADIIPVSSDTIDMLVEYFDKNGTESERAEAYYYQGSVYRDLKDYPRSISSFLKTKDFVPVTRDDSIRLKNTYSQLTSLNIRQLAYEEASKMAKAGCALAEMTNTQNPIHFADVASAARCTNNYEEANAYFRKAFECLQKDTCRTYPELLCEMLSYYSRMEMRDDAIACLAEIKKTPGIQNAFNYTVAMASYYSNLVSIDSAAVYHQQILAGPYNVAQKEASACWLMKYMGLKGQYKDAYRYALAYEALSDSAYALKRLEQTTRACDEHLYAVSLSKELAAQIKVGKYKRNMYLAMITLLVLALLACIMYSRKKRRFVKQLKESQQQLKGMVRLTLSSKASQNSGEVLNKFNDAIYGKAHLSDDDWKELYSVVESMYPGFSESVSSIPHVSEEHVRTAFLLKIGMKNSQIAGITGSSRQTVWSRSEKVRASLGDKLNEVAQ